MKRLIVAFLWLWSMHLYAQDLGETRKSFIYNLRQTSSVMQIDGLDNEEEWNDIEMIPHFMNHWPSDQGQAEALSQVWVTYDQEFVYIKAKLSGNIDPFKF